MATAVATERRAVAVGWPTLLRAAAVAQVLGLAATAVALGDVEALALAVVTVLGVVALRFRGGLLGTVLLGLLFADVAVFTVSAAIANILDGTGVAAVAMPAALGAVAIVGTIVAIGAIARRPRAIGSAAVRVLVVAAAAAFVLALSAAAVVPARATATAGALRLETKNTRYSTTEMAIGSAGTIVVQVSNGDLFWHTFSIDELGVDLAIPVGGAREIAFSAKPGTYTYYCRVPGHASAGMRGALTVGTR